MVKIIGQSDNFRADCTHCGAQLEFTASDVRAGERSPQSRDDHKSVITCPKCRRTVDVTSKYGASSVETYNRQQRENDYY